MASLNLCQDVANKEIKTTAAHVVAKYYPLFSMMQESVVTVLLLTSTPLR